MANPLEPDAELMLRVKRGDMAAFEELVEKYKLPVINLIYRTLHDFSEAEDLAQNVFVQVYKSAHRYEVTARFSTWLYTIARNLCLNEIRRRTRHPADSLEAVTENDEGSSVRQFEDAAMASPTEEVLHHELEEKIQKALAELPENQRTAILLCRQGDISYEEIAQVLGTSVSATKSLIHRGREVLRHKLKRYLQSGEWEDTEKESNFSPEPVLEKGKKR